MHAKNHLNKNHLTTAVLGVLLLSMSGIVSAQDQQTTPPADQTAAQDQAVKNDKEKQQLDTVTVTGSLIPRTQIDTFTPTTIVTAEDMQTRGFTSVSDVLQSASFSTGGVNNNQNTNTFTPGAETNSMFGMNPGYTKYLIDGRPMANYPALYNSSEVFNNISGIPIDLVDRIEILPGGQSSLYGSDAIAGVINIILKKHIKGTILSARYGMFDEGGGTQRRVGIADSFELADGRFNVLVGAQYEKSDPIWAYQRALTREVNLHPASGPRIAPRDWLIYGAYTSYHFEDPTNCARIASGFGGTVQLHTRPNRPAPYCGSMFSPGYHTIKNSKESGQLYTHATFDINDNVQLYGDVLFNREKVSYGGMGWWGTTVGMTYYYDPRYDDLMNLQRGFAPEDIGNDFSRVMNWNNSNSYAVAVGLNGQFGADSQWAWDVGFNRTQYRLTEISPVMIASKVDGWFINNIMGPQQGLDPWYDTYPVYTPDYAKFYTFLTPADYDSFTVKAASRSSTYDNMLRAQLTNSSLFSLPGGDAGMAVAVETGTQGWTYTPDPRYVADPVTLKSEIWGVTAISGGGSRSRYAVTGEMRLPVFDPLTISASARYDAYNAGGRKISKPTYSLGIEYRPFQSLMLRGRYGTAFKAPTLADQFQGLSGFYSGTADLLNCHKLGFNPSDLTGCPDKYTNSQFFGQSSGNTALEPINATSWTYGVIWAPSARFSLALDYHHWNIRNEVASQSAYGLMMDELRCTPVAQGGTGELDPASGTCKTALSQIRRVPGTGELSYLYLTKINVASEILDTYTAEMKYVQPMGGFGDLGFDFSYTHNLRHDRQTYPTDPVYDLIDYYYNSDPRYKANLAVSWKLKPVAITLYADRMAPIATHAYFNAPSKPATLDLLPAYTTYNASFNFDVGDALELSFMINNISGKQPTKDRTYDAFSSSPYNDTFYDVYGRSYYVQARYRFGDK